jgi:hypothetical protein
MPRATAEGKYYQLTHDYLVPSIREWLTRKQRETRRGRAEQLLEDLTNVWKKRDAVRPEDAYLPELDETVELLTQIDPSTLTGDRLTFLVLSARRFGIILAGMMPSARFSLNEAKYYLYIHKFVYKPYVYMIFLILLFLFGSMPVWLWIILLILSLLPICAAIYFLSRLVFKMMRMKKSDARSKAVSQDAALLDLMLKFHKDRSRLRSADANKSG